MLRAARRDGLEALSVSPEGMQQLCQRTILAQDPAISDGMAGQCVDCEHWYGAIDRKSALVWCVVICRGCLWATASWWWQIAPNDRDRVATDPSRSLRSGSLPAPARPCGCGGRLSAVLEFTPSWGGAFTHAMTAVTRTSVRA